jgi:hypothetical protein
MQTASELVDEIFDYASLLGVLLAGPDADTALDGMHRLVLQIRVSAEQLREAIKCA